ncbi:type III-I CRISPR precrRNA processing endoribonuclease Cas6 [Desulfamplus magnetovallimortis]|nr:hypothetical protein [Desulfamplus magnetovallimortis]
MLNMSFDLIRYLFVLEVNSTLVWLPKWPAMELSLLLGEVIADALPIVDARAWKKSLSAWHSYCSDVARKKASVKFVNRNPWPIDAVIFWYPAKRSYGKGERILFELKLLGRSADHELFVEVILPAMEQIAMNPYIGTKYKNSLWGHFDISSVYSARGSSWKPILKNGKLDLRRKIISSQWSNGLKFGPDSFNSLDRIRWLSPFLVAPASNKAGRTGNRKSMPVPPLSSILEAIAERVCYVTLGKYSTAMDFLNSIEKDELASWREAMKYADSNSICRHNIKKSSQLFSGLRMGSQTFKTPVHETLIPFLSLGSILHIGEYTHFGCGTYTMV